MRSGSDQALLWVTVGLLIMVGMIVAACPSTVVADAGCTYGVQRAQMPRPLGEGALASWVAVTDSAMTEACR